MKLNAPAMNDLVSTAMKYISIIQSNPDKLPLAGSGVNWISQAPSKDEIKSALSICEQINEPLPEQACNSVDSLFQFLFEKLAPLSTNDNSSGYLAYVPGGGLFQACLADFISLCLNRYVTTFMAAPGFAAIENIVIRWFCDIIGYPSTAGGVLTSGGSLANIYALHFARSYFFSKKADQFVNGRIYASNQTHCSLIQAMQLCGFSSKNFVNIHAHPSDFRICTDTLRKAIQRDLKQGKQPFMLVGNAGTTNTGAVDNLNVMADIAKEFDLWFHIDAAYGGFFMLTDHGQKQMKGIERADSVCMDPHKSLFLPYGTGSLLVRDQKKLHDVFCKNGMYLPSRPEQSSLPDDIMNLSPEMTREFRGLRVWLPIKMLGIKKFRDQLEEKLLLAQWACQKISEIDQIQIIVQPQLSTFVFKIQTNVPERSDEINKHFLNNINQQGRILLSPFRDKCQAGEFGIRMNILSFRTDKKRIEQGVEDIRLAANK
ncbi:L-2,4-diaminobutyrate decarboxylase [Candidatus Magnetomorum sp. HK-1]|nr:L-2,4-diaminobutyrate decarboxylase [Candidatus Magnetomorum sp. HK-1]